jgi:hypothetical protein
MELDLIEKIVLAVACPVFASALTVTVFLAQNQWEKERERRFWMRRNAEWIDCDVETYAKELRGDL